MTLVTSASPDAGAASPASRHDPALAGHLDTSQPQPATAWAPDEATARNAWCHVMAVGVGSGPAIPFTLGGSP